MASVQTINDCGCSKMFSVEHLIYNWEAISFFFALRICVKQSTTTIKQTHYSQLACNLSWKMMSLLDVLCEMHMKRFVTLCVCFRSCGECFQLCQRTYVEQVQLGAAAAFPQSGPHRGRAGGTDAAVCQRSQERQTQRRRLARFSIWNI